MRRVLLLGSSGFIGTWLVRELQRSPAYEVVIPPRSTWDLCRQETLAPMLAAARPDVVVNLAALSSTQADDREALYAVNAFGHLNLLTALREIGFGGHLVYVSSSNVYGTSSESPIPEGARPLPLNHYSCAKLLAEHFCAMFRFDFPITIVRPFNCIGVGQKPHFLVPKIADHFARRAPSIELGNLEVSRDFVDVRDAADMFMRVIGAETPPAIVNFANGEAESLSDLLAIFSEVSGHSPEIRTNPGFVRARDIVFQCGDATVIRRLGYTRRFTIHQTIRWIYDAYCEAGVC
ncbi:MAG: NAD-dependent epimerase/dehydratase family protein [Bauldia sp.]|nr:NAD-dependent epimerase/dehydratase family protein [Bauldia sp.]